MRAIQHLIEQSDILTFIDFRAEDYLRLERNSEFSKLVQNSI